MSELKKNIYILEVMKWITIVSLLLVTIVGNYFCREVIIFPLRMLIVAILITTASGIALLTIKGKAIITFAREARIEVRKVVWPSFQETMYTTVIIVLVTTIMSLILWGLDNTLFRLVSFITSLRF